LTNLSKARSGTVTGAPSRSALARLVYRSGLASCNCRKKAWLPIQYGHRLSADT
jgi:hypothetical protein